MHATHCPRQSFSLDLPLGRYAQLRKPGLLGGAGSGRQAEQGASSEPWRHAKRKRKRLRSLQAGPGGPKSCSSRLHFPLMFNMKVRACNSLPTAIPFLGFATKSSFSGRYAQLRKPGLLGGAGSGRQAEQGASSEPWRHAKRKRKRLRSLPSMLGAPSLEAVT